MSAFAIPSLYTVGNAGRGMIWGPGLANLDFLIGKRFGIPRAREGTNLEVRGEFYNVTNTPQFANPNGNVNAGTYAQVTTTLQNRGEREIQIAARITF